MLKKVNWVWLGVGILFALFVLPMLTGLIGKAKGGSSNPNKQS